FQTEGANRRVLAQIEGRYASSGQPIHSSFEVVEVQGESLIVTGRDGARYLAGKPQVCANCQVWIERVKGQLDGQVSTTTRELRFEERSIAEVIQSLKADGAEVWLSGEIKLDDADLLQWPVSLSQYNAVTVTGDAKKTLKLHAATIADLERAADYYGKGQLLV